MDATPQQRPSSATSLVEQWPDPVFPSGWVSPGLQPAVLAVCAGKTAPLWPSGAASGRDVPTAFRKHALTDLDCPREVFIGTEGVEGDEQADRRVHGGWQQAVYLYPAEHYAFWTTVAAQAQRPEPLARGGALGENLTIRGLLERDVYVGDILRIGEVVLRITKPRSPCFKFNAVMGFSQAAKLMNQSAFTGWYAMVIQPGQLTAGAPIDITPGARIITIQDMHRTSHGGSQGNLF